MDTSGSPGTATISSGSTGMFAVPAIADSPDTQQSASSGISHDQSHSSWKEVGHTSWSKDGERKRSSSASLSTPRRSAKSVMSPVRKEKRAIQIACRLQSVKDHSGEKDPQTGSGRGYAQFGYATIHINVTTMAMSRAFRNWNGELVQQVAHILRRSDEQLREAAQYIDIQRGKTRLSEDQSQHLVRIYGEYQEEARLKVLEYEKRHQGMAATVDLLEHRIRYEEESSLVSKNNAEQERRSVSPEIAQYQSMINSYQVKITTDSQNEENTIRGLRDRLETALMPQPTMAIDDEPQSTLVSKANDAIRYAEQEAHCARVAVSERDEMYMIGQRAVQERDAKMNEEIKIARDIAHQGNALHDRATLRDREFVDVTRELAVSKQSDHLNQIAAMSEEMEETRRELKIQESFVYQLAETNKELESENATQSIIAADSNDRGRALLRDDAV